MEATMTVITKNPTQGQTTLKNDIKLISIATQGITQEAYLTELKNWLKQLTDQLLMSIND
jgi:hypothetical protein